MKTHLFAPAVLLACATAAQAQHISPTQVPAAVKATFEARFPTVETTAWKKKTQQVKSTYEYETHNDFWARDAFLTQDVYEAGFRLNGQKMSVVMTPDGIVQKTETGLITKSLPPAVLATLARDFNAYQVQEAATVVRADGSTVYEAELALAGKKQGLHFTADGQLAPR